MLGVLYELGGLRGEPEVPADDGQHVDDGAAPHDDDDGEEFVVGAFVAVGDGGHDGEVPVDGHRHQVQDGRRGRHVVETRPRDAQLKHVSSKVIKIHFFFVFQIFLLHVIQKFSKAEISVVFYSRSVVLMQFKSSLSF